MEQKENLYIVFLKNACITISLGLFLYILIVHMLHLFSPDQIHTDPKVLNYLYMRFILTVAFVVGGFGIILSRFIESSKVPKQTGLVLKEKVSIFVSSSFFAYFYIGQVNVFTFLLKIIFICLVIFFYILLSKLIILYSSINLSEVHKFRDFNQNNDSIVNSLSKLISILIASLVLFFSIILMFNITIGYLNGNVEKDKENMKKLYITSIEPNKTTLAENVIIHGYNFGWNVDGRSKLMSSDGQIVTSLWQHDVIHFTVPLHVKTGNREYWVIKPVNENKIDNEVVQSNRISLKILPREAFFPEVGDNKITKLYKKIKRLILFNLQSVSKYVF